MAELVVSAATGALKPLLGKIAVELFEEYKRVNAVPDKISSLTKELEAMQAYLLKMSEVENPDEQDRVCTKEVRELSYDMEDCLDEFLRRVGDKSNTPEGVFAKLKNIMITKPKARHQIAKAIGELEIQVKEMGKRNARYKTKETISKTSTNAHVDPRALVIFEDASKLVGLEGPKQELIVLLTKTDGSSVSLLSIVGSGGLGKTTLAKQVYEELKGEFKSHAFVSVSRNPDMLNVLRNILCRVSNDVHPNMQEWDIQLLISRIHDSLRDKRYLIVIDDIWSKDAWKTVNCALCKNNKDSKIITTTRKHDVAKTCCSSDADFVYRMKPLSFADSKKLFFQRLYGSIDKCPDYLKDISYKILEKCDGLPLAIVSISGLLANKPQTEDEWDRVQNSIGRGLGKDVESMMQILSLSYFDLPHYLKTCLLYLSVFPEDFVIDKKLLVRRWIAEGFIQKEQGETSFKLGEWCFNELINRSLIQARKINMYGDVTACQVHDTILDFIVSKSEEENFITVFGDGYQMHGQHSKVRRLSINASSKEKVSTLTQLDLSHVRSVAVFHYSEELPMWSKFSFLRVLDLRGCRQVEGDHLTGIGNLFQLKYLSLRGTGVRELPEQISKLTCLETLDLKMSKVTKLHAGTAKLQGLIYLAVDKRVQLPDGTERMTALEDLDCVDIFKQSINFPQEFGQLKNLRNVQLFVSSDNCRDAAEASHYKKYMDDIVSSLCKLGHLHSLSIDGKAESKLDFSMDSGGDAPTGLQKFEITNHFISKVPNWVRSLFNLQFLTLRVKEFEVDDFMALGRLPALVFLRLEAHKCFHGRRISISGADGFQSLRHFDYCCAIPVTFKAGAMPKINKLTLMFSIFKTSQLATNEEFRFPFGVQHLTCLHSVCYLPYDHNFTKEFDEWITEKRTQIMAHMSCEQLMSTICEMESCELFMSTICEMESCELFMSTIWEMDAMDQMYMGEHRMDAAARTHLKSPKLTVRRTEEWGISISRTGGLVHGFIKYFCLKRLTAVKLKLKRITEGVITELSRNNCPLKGQGNCQCQGLLEAKARLNTFVIQQYYEPVWDGFAGSGYASIL